MDKHSSWIQARDKYFSERDWELKKCPSCSALYFGKKHKRFNSCQSYGCTGYSFLDIPPPGKFFSLSAGGGKVQRHFADNGYFEAQPINVVREKERTLFASAAGQIFDGLIYGGSQTHTHQLRCFVIQPVVRLQGISMIGKLDGISTSFLHSAVVHWNANAEDYFTALDSWLNLFSSFGLYVGDLTFKINSTINEWADKKVLAESLKLNYHGLEIGIANYFLGILTPEGFATMSDVGVGIERLLWAVNKSGSFFDAIGPLTFIGKGNTLILDSLRTMVLMAGSGVLPSHRNHGFKFRLIANKIAEPMYTFPVLDLVSFYYGQWSRFIQFDRPLQFVVDLIKREIDRNANLNLNRSLKREDSYNISHEEFLRSLMLEIGLKKLMITIKNGEKHEK